MPILSEQENRPVLASGVSVSPPGGTVLADTGPLNGGTYEIEWLLGATDPAGVGQRIGLEHRDAANGVTLRWLLMPTPFALAGRWTAFPIAQNERVRAISGLVGAVGSLYSAWISAIKIE